MLKLLLKKEFKEFTSSLFKSSRSGKKKSRLGPVGAVVLFAIIMIGVACGLFVFTGLFAASLILPDTDIFDWFYFAVMGLAALALGTFGSIFNTMSALYKAKDNEFLLSLPIEPWKILAARMAGVYFMSVIFTAILWIPASLRYWMGRGFPAKSVVLCILLTFVIALAVTVISCALGWVVASISGKLRNRSVVTVVISLIFLGIYYFVIFRMNSLVSSLAANADRISTAMKARVFPIYHLGCAAAGSVASFVIFTVIAVALFAVCAFVLSRTFIGIVTSNKGFKKVEYRESPLKASSVKKTLFTRELRHFTKSSTYMLNCGLGLVMLPVLAVILIVKREDVYDLMSYIPAEMPWIHDFVCVAVTAAVCLIIAMNVITAPSISIEGQNIRILQSLPLKPADILHAKMKLQIVLDLIPALFGIIVFGILVQPDNLTFVLMILTVLLFIPFDAAFGLRLNLKRPNLSWKSENVPIKQGMPIFIALFGGWGICVGPAVLYFFISQRLSAFAFLALCCAALAVVIILQERWIKGKGSRLFEDLN